LDRTEIEEQLARLIEQNEALRSRIAELEAKNEK
jgi:BMFP domain-containing protein YqiC